MTADMRRCFDGRWHRFPQVTSRPRLRDEHPATRAGLVLTEHRLAALVADLFDVLVLGFVIHI